MCIETNVVPLSPGFCLNTSKELVTFLFCLTKIYTLPVMIMTCSIYYNFRWNMLSLFWDISSHKLYTGVLRCIHSFLQWKKQNNEIFRKQVHLTTRTSICLQICCNFISISASEFNYHYDDFYALPTGSFSFVTKKGFPEAQQLRASNSVSGGRVYEYVVNVGEFTQML